MSLLSTPRDTEASQSVSMEEPVLSAEAATLDASHPCPGDAPQSTDILSSTPMDTHEAMSVT
eukprot:1848765-Amphidinium_carterae.1